MNNELSPGDLARIIESVEGSSTGAIVQCRNVVGTHSLFGIIWRVTSKQKLVTEHGGVGYECDVPAKWLKKIPPGELDLQHEVEKLCESSLIQDMLGDLSKT
jgi:hypothetical protein